MKILSYNIRGAGSRIKSKEVRDLICKFDIDFCCLQESKLESMCDSYAETLWGGRCGWEARDSIGRSGGIITLWNLDKFSCSSSWHMDGAVIVNGFWGEKELNVVLLTCMLLNPWRKEMICGTDWVEL